MSECEGTNIVWRVDSEETNLPDSSTSCPSSFGMHYKFRKLVNEIAYAQDRSKLSAVHRALIPLLSVASSFYKVALCSRWWLYHLGFLSSHQLPVPVISVGNLTWGGNGKTPMVEFASHSLLDFGISPLILTRGYAGGDEAKMLMRHFRGKPVKVGVGANRTATAIRFLRKYGYIDSKGCLLDGTCQEGESQSNLEKIGAVVLDDGMQHWSLQHDLEIVMVNGSMPWGNRQLAPLGPLRETMSSLKRADAVVVHHANLVTEKHLSDVEFTLKEVKESLPVFFTVMSASHFFDVGDIHAKIPLNVSHDAVVLCVSGIGSSNAFVLGMRKVGARCVYQLDFCDHHNFQQKDMDTIKIKLKGLEDMLGSKPVVVITEKDYDRDPGIFGHLYPFRVLVLCPDLQFIPRGGFAEDDFKALLREILDAKFSALNERRRD